MLTRLLLPLACCLGVAASCTPSPEDLIDELASTRDREAVRQELLLSGRRAVGPLVAALEQPRPPAVRREIATLLTELLTRTDDARVSQALHHLLRADTDPALRAFIARRLGQLRRAESVDALIEALQDDDDAVRREVLISANLLKPHLEDRHLRRLREIAPTLMSSADPEVSEEAEIWARPSPMSG